MKIEIKPYGEMPRDKGPYYIHLKDGTIVRAIYWGNGEWDAQSSLDKDPSAPYDIEFNLGDENYPTHWEEIRTLVPAFKLEIKMGEWITEVSSKEPISIERFKALLDNLAYTRERDCGFPSQPG